MGSIIRCGSSFSSIQRINMKRFIILVFVQLLFVGFTTAKCKADQNGIKVFHQGVYINISLINDSVLHVTKSPDLQYRSDSLVVLVHNTAPSVCQLEKRNKHLLLTTSKVMVDYHEVTGIISVSRLDGRPLISEQSVTFTPRKDGPFDSYTVKQSFMLSPDERIYGLGQIQNGRLNQRGQHFRLLNENMKICIPMFLSSKGYALYWENYSPTDFDDDTRATSFTSTGRAIDYYVLVGNDVASAQRALFDLTGHVSMPALWNLGVWQSRERYTSSRELLDALKRLRSLRVPVDCMVQDWQYWGDNMHWNAQRFLNPAFADYQQMIDSVHALNAKLMVSVWPDYGPDTEQYCHLQALEKLLPGKSFPNDVESRVYDAFDSYARRYYWHQLYNGLLRYGVDALWLDSTEPDYSGNEADLDFVTGAGRTWRSLRNAFPISTVWGVYNSHRHEPSLTNKRVSILTRSAFMGMQRTGAFVWSGDIEASWHTLARQIPAALNASISGIPLWNSDTGGFWVRDFEGGCQNPAYRRLFARWTQFSTFTPMLRFHGTNTPREIWNYGSEGDSEGTYDNILRYIRLRYRLLPWLYAQTHQLCKDGTLLMSALPVGYPADFQAADIIDEYLFGQSFLVAPILKDRAEGRQIYLPVGNDWIDFWTGETLKGGQWLYKQASYNVIPLYVKAGSILPWGPDVQYSTEKKWDDLEIRIYPGADGDFTLYEDAFDGYGHENGQSSEIRFHWDDAACKLTVAKREGSYPGMLAKRTFRVVLVTPEQPLADGHATVYQKSIIYDGTSQTIELDKKNNTAQKQVYNHVFAPSEGWVNRYEKPYRSEICLNGYWDFQPVDLPADFVHGKGMAPELPLPQDDVWDKTRIKIPSPWNVNGFAFNNLEGPDHRNYPSYPKEWEHVKMAWMRKIIQVPSDWRDKHISLHFEAVAGETVIYVNGKEIGKNFDLFLPFDLDVTNVVEAGRPAEILVGVRSQWLFEDESTIGRRILPAGSMWGNYINGIWQDVYLLATPKVYVKDVFVKPLVSKGVLEIEVTIENHTESDKKIQLSGKAYEWLNHAGTEVNTAPVPNWSLGKEALTLPLRGVNVEANKKTMLNIKVPVSDDMLRFWTPEHPNLYAFLLTIKQDKQILDTRYQRFGWREWTFNGMQLCLNGHSYPLKSDSWHFMGIPQMSRRYAWAWYKAIKGMNGNAVRLHAQVYPRFYMDMADEMGICVLDETANWASDGGPKLDSELFFEHSRDHLRRFVQRDRNYPSVFGWSISNENKPVILYVFKRPDLLPRQKKEWGVWRDIVREIDPTRPWISSDGEDDGDGMLPVTVGHYGDNNAMKNWCNIGKPWGIGETGMCYYGTPEQVSKCNGQRAFDSAEGRMEGLATECYHLIKDMRMMGASYTTIFNMVWYALKPLSLGKKEISTAPTLADGIFFGSYVEGQPGVQPERIGPYSTTLNPGYDPNLPLYDTWPLYDAIRAANAEPVSAWSSYATVDTMAYVHHKSAPVNSSLEVYYIGDSDSSLKQILDAQGVVYTHNPKNALVIIDAGKPMTIRNLKNMKQASSIWLWGIIPETVNSFRSILSSPFDHALSLQFDQLGRSSFLPVNRSWMSGLQSADFYFCEVQKTDASQYTMKGDFVNEGEILLNACRTDWRSWNLRPEELKTAGLLRSENECTVSLPVFVKNGDVYVSTLTNFTNTTKGFNTLSAILRNAGVKMVKKQQELKNECIKHKTNNLFLDPSVDTSKKTTQLM